MVPSRTPANDTVLPELIAICGPGFARPAGPGDTVADVPARWVAAPGSVSAVTETMRLAARHRLAVVPRGAGSKLDWGSPPTRVDLVLDTGRLAGIRHHSTDGLVAEAGAGTPLRAAQSVLARAGQRLALDPASVDATVGGVIAADEAGPLRHRYGAPREQLVGVSYVGADGTLTSTTGRVARTSTGQDVARLLFGSNGALGVLVSATFRVHPVPAARCWVSRSVWTPLEVHDLVGEALAGQLAPAAVEVDLPGSSGTLSILLEGRPARVDARAQQAAAVLRGDAWISAAPPPWWGRYPFAPGEVALKLAVPISDLHAVVYALRDAAGTTVPVRGSAGVGVVYAALPGHTPPERLAAVLEAVRGVLMARGGSCVVLSAPPALRAAVDVWGDVGGLALLRQLKRRFDPEGRLAPGRFIGGL
ncbi:MAG: FAD-binding oxidoreductase [Micromonosporaceae bacterium]|jgi:glycolate oxidase FAD binding subunit|nr:FAD-binding oxidoreductase [Micromonosporaceae bacterium]